MTFSRLIKHLLTTNFQIKKHFTEQCLHSITSAIREGEVTHMGEIRFAIETALEPGQILRGITPQKRAIEVFSELRVWDTEYNSGVLIYVLFADRAVEIIADRGIHAKTVDRKVWSAITRVMQEAFAAGQFETGAMSGVAAVTAELTRHFPVSGENPDELANDVDMI